MSMVQFTGTLIKSSTKAAKKQAGGRVVGQGAVRTKATSRVNKIQSKTAASNRSGAVNVVTAGKRRGK